MCCDACLAGCTLREAIAADNDELGTGLFSPAACQGDVEAAKSCRRGEMQQDAITLRSHDSVAQQG
jgi:hypothetical protein